MARPHVHAFSPAEEAAQAASLIGTVISNMASISGIAKNTQTDLATAGAAISLIADSGKLLDIVSRPREIGQSWRSLAHAAAVTVHAAGQALKIYADRRAALEGDNVTEATKNYQLSAMALTSVSALAMAASKPNEAHATLADRRSGATTVLDGELTQSPAQLSAAGSRRSLAASLSTSTAPPNAASPSAAARPVTIPAATRPASPHRR
jgi:hypothetical protein